MLTLLPVVCLLFVATVILSLLICRKLQRAMPCGKRLLLVIAHPDDETMFFAPTLHGLIECGVSVHILCVCSGNSLGLGQQRKLELARAIEIHGVPMANLTILNYEKFRDGLVSWPKEYLAKTVLTQVRTLDVSAVLTFDEYGVSSHPNHVACFLALQYLYTNGLIPAGVQVFTLETVPLWRKYSVFFDAMISSCHSTFLYVSSPLAYVKIWHAMYAHSSQLVWFRYLYMMFSRYVTINTLKRIHLRPRHPVKKKESCASDPHYLL